MTEEILQRDSFSYFTHETNPANGLVIDKTSPDCPASIAATGLALAAVGWDHARAEHVSRFVAWLRALAPGSQLLPSRVTARRLPRCRVRRMAAPPKTS